MEQIAILIALAIFGLCMGSFAGATVWRLRARQLVEDKSMGEDIEMKEYKALLPLTKLSFSRDRSRCLHCGHRLAWFDLVPIVSWLSVGGRCRYCRTPIGRFEPLMELGAALLFILSYSFWPQTLGTATSIAYFGLWLVACVMLVILFAYDLKWFLLPNVIVFPLIAIGGLVALLHLLSAKSMVGPALLNLFGAVIILSGLYYGLWLISKGQWIGFGDVKLGLALALFLGDWQLAFLALFVANLIGCFFIIPGMLMGKISRMTRVPFGPLLILGGIISMIFGRSLLDLYMQILL